MDGYQISAIKQARIINRSYNQTCSYVQSEIAKILRHIGDEDSLAYEYRMRRLNALLANTRKMMQELYGITLNDTTEFLRNIIPEAYYHTIFDVAQGAGEQPVFSAVNTRLIDKIVNDQWSGKNYSQRIWWNTSKLSEDVQQLLTTAAMSGESIYKTSRRLSERFGESMNNSIRLIRTETTYACNQAEMASYKSLDIDRYKFVATLDTRTSTICQKLDGKVFETKDAQAGKNLPSMHPNCRSTTIPYFEDGMPEIRAARDKDGNRIKVPADMTYPEWYEKYIKPSEGGNGSQKPSAPSKGKDTAKSGNGSQKPQKPLDSKPAEINIPAPDNGQPEYTDTPIPKNVHNSSVDKSGVSGIIRESSKPKPITEITDKAIESIPKVNISGYTDEQCAMIQKQHKELLEYSRKNNGNKEVAFVFDSSLESRKEFIGSDDKIDFGRGLYGSNITVLHNHPRNSSYSVTDIIFFGDNSNIKTLTIVKNNGKVEYLTKGEDFDPAIFKLEYDRLYRKIVKSGTDSEKDKFVKNLLNKSKSGVIWSERT
jgi:SPP1 gp7 family putative phage head morphogenesis protein